MIPNLNNFLDVQFQNIFHHKHIFTWYLMDFNNVKKPTILLKKDCGLFTLFINNLYFE